MSEHLAKAVGCMLPLRIFDDCRYEVARAALSKAAPHLSAHSAATSIASSSQIYVGSISRPRLTNTGCTACAECAHFWPCSIERSLAGSECDRPSEPHDPSMGRSDRPVIVRRDEPLHERPRVRVQPGCQLEDVV